MRREGTDEKERQRRGKKKGGEDSGEENSCRLVSFNNPCGLKERCRQLPACQFHSLT